MVISAGIQSPSFWELISLHRIQGFECLLWSSNFLLLREKYCVFDILPQFRLSCLGPRVSFGFFLVRTCPCHCYSSQYWPLCLLLWRLSSSFQGFFWGCYSIYSTTWTLLCSGRGWGLDPPMLPSWTILTNTQFHHSQVLSPTNTISWTQFS